MAANHNIDSNYLLGLSTAGILFNEKDRYPRFSSRFDWTRSPYLPQVADHRIIVCSSSDGLIACLDTVSNIYYIGNPAIYDSYTPFPETPRKHSPYFSSAVLVSNYALTHFYHLICAVHDSKNVYNFDVYCSLSGCWYSSGRIDLECCIMTHTGASCGTFTYWLAENPRSVIRFDINCPQNKVLRIPLDRKIFGPGTLLQLGRVGNTLSLVTFEVFLERRVILYLLEHGNLWQLQPYVAFNLPMSNLSVPSLIRFQSFKAELFFSVGGRLFLWEENTVGQPGNLRMVNRAAPQNIGYGLAHVITPLLPWNFDMTF